MYGEAGKSYYGAVKADAGLTLCSPHFKNTFYLSGGEKKKKASPFPFNAFLCRKIQLYPLCSSCIPIPPSRLNDCNIACN